MSGLIERTSYEKKIRKAHDVNYFRAVDAEFLSVWRRVACHTMLSREQVFDLYCFVKYVTKNRIDGDIVEIGTWKGGGVLACALALKNTKPPVSSGAKPKVVFGYDTFEGHPAPRRGETDIWGKDQFELSAEKNGTEWAKAELSEVQRLIAEEIGGDCDVRLIKGLCEATIPDTAPEKISVLRLDVDWYEPTKFCSQALYPRLTPGGVLIIDDYGHHLGARQAVTEFFEKQQVQPKLFWIDYSCVSMIKN